MRPAAILISLAAAAAGLVTAPSAGAVGLGGLYSCSSPGQANTTGAVVGGLLGALAGSQVSKNERVLGAAAGAAIGAAIGNSIGCRMDRDSRQRAQSAFERALETGRPQTWADDRSGATGRIEVIGRGGGAPSPGGRPWRFAEGVERVQMSRGGGVYEATSRVAVRSGPNVAAPVVDRLSVGEQVQVVGASNGWLAIEEDGFVVGYASASALQPGYGAGGGGGVAADCRIVQQTITSRGYSPEVQRYSACRDAGGAWQLTAI